MISPQTLFVASNSQNNDERIDFLICAKAPNTPLSLHYSRGRYELEHQGTDTEPESFGVGGCVIQIVAGMAGYLLDVFGVLVFLASAESTSKNYATLSHAFRRLIAYSALVSYLVFPRYSALYGKDLWFRDARSSSKNSFLCVTGGYQSSPIPLSASAESPQKSLLKISYRNGLPRFLLSSSFQSSPYG